MAVERIGGVRTGSGGQQLPFCQASKADGWLYVSGQVAFDETGEIVPGGIVQQAHQTIRNVIAILDKAGYGLDDVVKVNVWLDDPRDFQAFNRVYAGYFGDSPPARSCVRSALMVDGKVEIDAIAYRSQA